MSKRQRTISSNEPDSNVPKKRQIVFEKKGGIDAKRAKYLHEGLLHACESGYKDMAQFFIDIGANPKSNRDALVRASIHGHSDIVKFLLEAGEYVPTVCDQALVWGNRHAEVVKILLEAGANVHTENDYALRHASRRGYVEVVRVLVKAGANVHAEDDEALQLASSEGCWEVVQLLLDAGANVHSQNDNSLRGAAINRHRKVVEILLSYGANPTVLIHRLRGITKMATLMKNHVNNICDSIPLPRDITHNIIRPYLTNF